MAETSQQNHHDDTIHQNGFPLLFQQYASLLKMNIILAQRNKTGTLLRLFSPFFVTFLLFAIFKVKQSLSMNSEDLREVIDPKPLISPPISPCEDMFFVRLPCHDFIWSGNGIPKVAQIVAGIMKNNPGRPIPMNRTKSFATKEEAETWLTENPETCPGALHFTELNATVVSYGVETNSSKLQKRGRIEDSMFKFYIPLQLAAEREITRHRIGDSNFPWDVELKQYAHPALEEAPPETGRELPYFLGFAMFAFFFQITSLVNEKELKLRQAMTLRGLSDTAYWLSWFTWELTMTLFSSLMIVLSGMMFQLDFFLKNSLAIVFLLFFFFQFNMTSFAVMLSNFIGKASSAIAVGFLIFAGSFVVQGFSKDENPFNGPSTLVSVMWAFFPPNLFNQALTLITDRMGSSGDFGVSWRMRTECIMEMMCGKTINEIYIWLGATFFLWLILAIYLENVIPNSFGVRKPPYYFLLPGYWSGKGGNTIGGKSYRAFAKGGLCSRFGTIPALEPITDDDDDVREEEYNVKAQAQAGSIAPNVVVQIRGLVKTYPGTAKGCCPGCYCCCKKTPPYHAIEGLWLNIHKDQLFCLLGPNGAGKTTIINCLTGLTPATSGDALIYGHSISDFVGMTNIRKMIGVCPQFDNLWESLTGQEHLELFANIRGLPPALVKSVVDNLMEELKITNLRNVRAGKYSRGMKRRLSIAAALIGNPKILILDDPTTGMDPIARQHLWNIIENVKKGRSIVLTTHSEEEADILSDRVGLVARGRLRCIGTPISLKSRFGTGFVATLSFSEMNNDAIVRNQEAVKQFFQAHLDVTPRQVNSSFITFGLPHDREDILANVFRALEGRKREFGIAEIQLGMSTLKEVFLDIAKQAEQEKALAEQSWTMLTLPSRGCMRVLTGARFVDIPGTESPQSPRGLMVELGWGQDESGNYNILGHSDEFPIPPHVQLSPSERLSIEEQSLTGRNVQLSHSEGSSIEEQSLTGRNVQLSHSEGPSIEEQSLTGRNVQLSHSEVSSIEEQPLTGSTL